MSRPTPSAPASVALNVAVCLPACVSCRTRSFRLSSSCSLLVSCRAAAAVVAFKHSPAPAKRASPATTARRPPRAERPLRPGRRPGRRAVRLRHRQPRHPPDRAGPDDHHRRRHRQTRLHRRRRARDQGDAQRAVRGPLRQGRQPVHRRAAEPHRPPRRRARPASSPPSPAPARPASPATAGRPTRPSCATRTRSSSAPTARSTSPTCSTTASAGST